MKYAVVKSGGKQYKVIEGKEILVDKLDVKTGESYQFPEVLLVRTEKEVFVGSPFVSGYSVIGKIISEEKGEKIRVSKFKAKVRYRRTIGFRPIFSKILVEKIAFDHEVTEVVGKEVKKESQIKNKKTREKTLDKREKKE